MAGLSYKHPSLDPSMDAPCTSIDLQPEPKVGESLTSKNRSNSERSS